MRPRVAPTFRATLVSLDRSQSRQRNLRPPVFAGSHLIGLPHFLQGGGGAFFGMGALAVWRGSITELAVTDRGQGRGDDWLTLRPLSSASHLIPHSKTGGLLELRHPYSLQLSSLHLHSNMRTVFPVRELSI